LSKNKEVLKNIGLSILYKPIGILISLALVPLTIKYLGNTSYGLWATILSIISWINYFDIGIGNGLRNHLAREITVKNYKDSREYIMTAYGSVTFISIIILIALTVLFKIFNWNSIFNIDSYTNQELFFIMLVNLVFIVMNFVLKIVATIYYSLQKSSTVGLIQILNQLFNLIGIYSLYRMEYANSLLGISVVYGLGMVLSNIIFTLILFIKNRELVPKFKDFKYDKVKSLSGLGIKFFIIQIAAMIIFTTDNMIITKLLGPEEVTPYNITFKVFSIIIMLHGIIIAPLWSAITKAYAEKDVEWIKRTLKKLKGVQLFILLLIFGISLNFNTIITVWIGDKFVIPITLIINFAVYTFLVTLSNIYATFLNGMGELKLSYWISIFSALINIPLSIYFVKVFQLGTTGVIIATNICLLIGVITGFFQEKYYIGGGRKKR